MNIVNPLTPREAEKFKMPPGQRTGAVLVVFSAEEYAIFEGMVETLTGGRLVRTPLRK